MNKYETLKSIIDEVDVLIKDQVHSGSERFQAWHNKVARFLIKHYGEDSYEYKDFLQQNFSPMIYTSNMTDSDYIEPCKRGLSRSKAILTNYLDDMDDKQEEDVKAEKIKGNYSSVFIVHGHNGELREAMARLIEKQKIKPIILMEQANKGATIIEKIENNSETNAAICLFTADDDGKAANSSEVNKRARQNVVFEAGFFIGKLGRERTIIVADRQIELPSDLQGVVYTDVHNWKYDVLKELKAIGYTIDFNLMEG